MILVCGEALIDLFVGTAAAAELPARAIAGGSPFNLAVGLSRLGAASAYLGGISTDALGGFLLGRLAAERVHTGFARRSARPTPLVVVAPGPDGQPAYTFHATNCADRDVAPDDLPPALPGVQALALGSYAIAVEPVGSALLALAAREAGRLPISLDPNVRPALAGDPAAWRTRFAAFARLATVIKLSREDLQLAWGPDADPARHAAGWLADGAELVVLTDGAAGATAFHAAGTCRVPGRAVEVIDTVGAGDTFHAALLAGLAGRGALRRGGVAALDAAALDAVLARAVLASSITCTRRGADLPTAAEVDACS